MTFKTIFSKSLKQHCLVTKMVTHLSVTVVRATPAAPNRIGVCSGVGSSDPDSQRELCICACALGTLRWSPRASRPPGAPATSHAGPGGDR